MPSPRLARLTLFTIAVNLGVILWGAWVRLSGSGAGCGRHWPLCDGQVIPDRFSAAMVVEFAHRVTSGLALLLVVLMVVLARRDFPAGHPARRWARISLIFIVIEALVGAGLVLFRYVEDNASTGRAIWLGGHLLNTLLMLGAFWITRWCAQGGTPPSLATLRREQPLLATGLAAILLTGMAGAVASLGDMLYPSATLAEGLRQDFAPDAPLLLRLRIWHPLVAIATGMLWLLAARLAAGDQDAPAAVRRPASMVTGLVLAQWALGTTTLVLLVPVPLQLLHLLTADLLWLAALHLVLTRLGVRPDAPARR